MEISKDTANILEFLDYTSGNNLRKRDDLGLILEIGAIKGSHELVNNIVFMGKYLWNLHKMIKRTSDSDEGKEKIISEAAISSVSLKEAIAELISGVDAPENLERFNSVYLVEGQGAYRNLIDLAHDLSKLKEVQNTLKNK